MGLFAAIKDFFAGLFSRDPVETHKRKELKRIYSHLATIKPSLYRPSQKQVLTGFADLYYTFYRFLRPISNIIHRTLASSDARQSQRFFDCLIEAHLPAEEKDKKQYFHYEGMKERVERAVKLEDEIEEISAEFQSFMAFLESPGLKAIDIDLVDMERLVEVCRYDYERILGLFDPGMNLSLTQYRPDFHPIAAESLAPELIDFYYVIAGFSFTPKVEKNLSILLDHIQVSDQDRELTRKKMDKFFQALNRLLRHQLSSETILFLLRAIKADSTFSPETARSRLGFLEAYRQRLNAQFQRDKERVLRERYEDAMSNDIRSLFGNDIPILEMDYYNDDNSALLSRDSPFSFNYVKGMRILKTFLLSVFEPNIRDTVKRVLVEGFFDNKAFQNNLANVFFQCEHASQRMADFEEQQAGSGRLSLVAMKRYLEEARRGKDVQMFLAKQTESINARAQEILENETGLFNMMAEAIYELINDQRRGSPELISNARTLGGGRNKEIMSSLANGLGLLQRFIKVMRHFTSVKASPGPAAPTDPSGIQEI